MTVREAYPGVTVCEAYTPGYSLFYRGLSLFYAQTGVIPGCLMLKTVLFPHQKRLKTGLNLS